MVRRGMRRAPGLAGGAVQVRVRPITRKARSERSPAARVRFEVDDRCRHLTTPSLWYSEKAGNWAMAVIIVGLWVAAIVEGLVL